MDRTPEGHVICLDIPSSMQLVYVLDSVISQILREMGFDEESREQVNLAVIEAGTNAIKHGNKEDVKKRAHFEFILNQDKLTVVVQDGGAGFDRKSVENPLDPENLVEKQRKRNFSDGNLYGHSYLRNSRHNGKDGEVQETVE